VSSHHLGRPTECRSAAGGIGAVASIVGPDLKKMRVPRQQPDFTNLDIVSGLQRHQPELLRPSVSTLLDAQGTISEFENLPGNLDGTRATLLPRVFSTSSGGPGPMI